MQLVGKLEIKSKEKMISFLNSEDTGRVASIDSKGFPQIIPMNFVFFNNAVYMHSHTRGEKIDNIKNNDKVGFEVDRNVEFLPSYYSHPTDASRADNLYISVIIKGNAILVKDRLEKVRALNELMKKYQPEGGYEPVSVESGIDMHVAIIKVIPISMKGKYKIGQHMDDNSRLFLAKKIFERNSPTAKEALKTMGVAIKDGQLIIEDELTW